MSTLFDTLAYTKGAEKVGIKREHAEYQAKELAKLVDEQLVTKSFLREELLKLELKLCSIIVKGNLTLGSVLIIFITLMKFFK